MRRYENQSIGAKFFRGTVRHRAGGDTLSQIPGHFHQQYLSAGRVATVQLAIPLRIESADPFFRRCRRRISTRNDS